MTDDDDLAEETPPDGCRLYYDSSQVPHEIVKYWRQRYDIFSLYDNGIWTTDDSWYGVTPEPVASYLSLTLAQTVHYLLIPSV